MVALAPHPIPHPPSQQATGRLDFSFLAGKLPSLGTVSARPSWLVAVLKGQLGGDWRGPIVRGSLQYKGLD